MGNNLGDTNRPDPFEVPGDAGYLEFCTCPKMGGEPCPEGKYVCDWDGKEPEQ